jgi:DNA-binding winged helix-turn-helix (wHTH) protein/TolB-like protein
MLWSAGCQPFAGRDVQGRTSASYRFGRFRLDPADERLIGPDGPIRLGNKAYRVLLALIEQQGRLVTKDSLFETVWDGTFVSESALTSVIKELRRALGDDARAPQCIESAYGRGYRFICEVSREEEASTPAPVPAPPPRLLAPDRTQPDHDPAPLGAAPVLLVSAFEDLAVRDSHPWLGTALREEVLSGLARFSEIQLMADDRPEREAAAAREAPGPRDYQLTAMLLPDGAEVKVIARAKRLRDGRIVWAETMSLAGLGNAGGVERIVRRIIGAAFPAVDNDISLGLPDGAPDIYDRYLVAKRQSQTARTFAEARAAADALERLIADRPDFGLAYPPLVRLYNIDFGWTAFGSTGPAELARALELAKTGLAADQGNVHAHTVLAFCYLRHGEWDAAGRSLETALALNPNNPWRLREVATGFAYLGEFQRSESLFESSRDLQPVPDDHYFEDRCQLALLQGKLEEALGFARKISEQRLWLSLYEAICLLETEPDAGFPKLARWRAWVERCWHVPGPVNDEELVQWTGLHHPLPPRYRASFLTRISEGLTGLIAD